MLVRAASQAFLTTYKYTYFYTRICTRVVTFLTLIFSIFTRAFNTRIRVTRVTFCAVCILSQKLMYSNVGSWWVGGLLDMRNNATLSVDWMGFSDRSSVVT